MQDTVTCCMLYYGRKDVAEESMASFLLQTYPHKKLLIVNTHPDPVWFEKEYPNIEVHNLPPDKFKNLNEKYNYALANVKTKWWAPWDSDDIWLPWHLKNLAAYIPNTEPNGLPRKIALARSYFMLHKRQEIKIGWNMWGTAIWETFDKDGNHHAQCDPKKASNCDRQITYLDWDRHWLDRGGEKSPISFIFRWHVEKNHNRSAILGQKGIERAETIKEKLMKTRITEPWRPHWSVDYTKKIRGKHEMFAGI